VTARPRFSLLLAAATCALAAAVTGVLALVVAVTERADLRVSLAVSRIDTSRSSSLLAAISHLADPLPYAVVGLVLTAVAWLRHERRLAVTIPLLFVATGLTTELLKRATDTARWWDAPLWPSGHATAAVTMALCAILVSPPRLRPLVAILGGVFAIAVAGSMVALSAHMASDVISGSLIAAAYVLTALATVAAPGSAGA
jgi:membrane-associated phospholipid phosphatase